ncbi:maltotransferase domain-containing protein [Noviherbaspirillum massiliense]|uniref:maltotransferase domain-containing protein n=1 Tax=Noviherbaspirillum massiliense TaxID=1465823 RepID=UPI00030469BF|nr:maltotransferase domain-containing protein [Noviherbaspirillum massiliense]
MSMPRATPFLPRIYALHPATPASELDAHLDRCAQMGFTHVLMPTVSAAHAGEAPGALTRSCARNKLQLLVDLDIGSVAGDNRLADTHPHWFTGEEADDLPDPRRLPQQQAVRRLRLDDPQVAEDVLGWWLGQLRAFANAGVAGFRCIDVAGPPASYWKKLIEAAKAVQPSLCFLAWTPGCTPEQLEALADCGFDGSFSSGAWWDYRSRWLVEEQARLARIAPPIAFPDSPDGEVIARVAGFDEIGQRRRLFQRALRLAAATGNGILVPMGFEYGMSRRDAAAGDGEQAVFDLSDEISRANAFIAASGADFYGAHLRLLSGLDAQVAVLLREPWAEQAAAQPDSGAALLIVANADSARACAVNDSRLLERGGGFVRHERIWPQSGIAPAPGQALELAPAELQVFSARRLAPILTPLPQDDDAIIAAARMPRIAIEAVTPSADEGRFPVKRIIGDVVQVEADVFIDGHDKLAVVLLWRSADETEWHETRMHPLGNDRWCAPLPLTRIGRYLFAVEAWRDAFATYRDELEKKTTAGLNVSLELEEGRLMVEAAARHAKENGISVAATLSALAQTLRTAEPGMRDAAGNDGERIAALLSEPTMEAMRAADARPFAVRSEPVLRIDVERPAARFSSWYELFPRSQSGDPARHGTFDDVIRRLPAIRAMGFDTLYFPPIHPIGRKHRKGRNNSLTAGPGEPGSPYAIGAEEGGHDAIHPQLGTLDDFRRLRDEAKRHGLELALDFAIQCSPDHPWLKQHPEWFAWRPDGSLRYAENPPKKYQDIVNVDFYAKGAVPGLWMALRDVVLFWVREGVRVFRVDNPHTKPLPFWEWMIADIRGRHPDTIFLSEAFTRPKMMYRLAKAGFSQSYTYFTWRHTKEEFTEYLTELTQTSVREYFRPHFFVNTPDINPYFLQRSGRPGFLIRAALATMLSGLWGMYSGFELCEGTPIPGKEEYLDSEKYEIKAWDWQRPGNIIREISQLNRIRMENPALQSHMGVRFLQASDDNILYFAKTTEPADSGQRIGDNVVLVAINLDPFAAHDAKIELPMWEFGLADDGMLEADDLVNGGKVSWHGKTQQLRLDPYDCPYAIWRIRHRGT